MLRIGQKLWYVDHAKNTEGTVIVADIEKDGFWVWYNQKRHFRKFTVLGKTLFFQSQLPVITPARETEQKSPFFESTSLYAYLHGNREEDKKSFLPKEPEQHAPLYRPEQHGSSTPACDNCALRKNETCSSLSNTVCEDYRPVQRISQEELDSWPEYGDALAYRFKNRKHFTD